MVVLSFTHHHFRRPVGIEVNRILDHTWDALDLWVRGELDDGNDHAFNQLSVRKALTCLEGQSSTSLRTISSTSTYWCPRASRGRTPAVQHHARIHELRCSRLYLQSHEKHNKWYANNLFRELPCEYLSL